MKLLKFQKYFSRLRCNIKDIEVAKFLSFTENLREQKRLLRQSYRIANFLLLTTLAIVWVTACSPNSQNLVSQDIPTRIVEHAMGETAVPENPQRIIVLEPFSLESLLAMEIHPVGAPLDGLNTHLKEKTEGIKNIGNPPNLENVIALNPDIIIGSQYSNQEIYSQASQVAPTVLFEFTGSGDWKQMMKSVGNAVNEKALATEVLEDYNRRIQEFKAKMSDSLSETKVSLVRVYPDEISLYQKGSFAGTILEDVGLSRPPAQQGKDVQTKISKERILDADGDVMFIWTYSNNAEQKSEAETALQQLQADPLWSKLNVVQKGEVYEVGEHWLGTGAVAANLVIDDLFKYLVLERGE